MNPELMSYLSPVEVAAILGVAVSAVSSLYFGYTAVTGLKEKTYETFVSNLREGLQILDNLRDRGREVTDTEIVKTQGTGTKGFMRKITSSSFESVSREWRAMCALGASAALVDTVIFSTVALPAVLRVMTTFLG